MHDSKFEDFSEDSEIVDHHVDDQLKAFAIQLAARQMPLGREFERAFFDNPYDNIWDYKFSL